MGRATDGMVELVGPDIVHVDVDEPSHAGVFAKLLIHEIPAVFRHEILADGAVKLLGEEEDARAYTGFVCHHVVVILPVTLPELPVG